MQLGCFSFSVHGVTQWLHGYKHNLSKYSDDAFANIFSAKSVSLGVPSLVY